MNTAAGSTDGRRRATVADGSSFTAEAIALQRALETHQPARRRLLCDPHASAFLRPSLRLLANTSRIPGLRSVATALHDAVGGPAPRASAIVRTRLIDTTITTVMQTWPEPGQLVILGAGYDTRAHRLPELTRHRVFEIDYPTTQAAKQRVVRRLALPDWHIRYLPVDFESDDLRFAALRGGFDPTRASLFLWEGVSNYLSSEAVTATLQHIRSLGGERTGLVMTYIDVRALTLPNPFPEAEKWSRVVARAKEPWVFGLHPDDAEAFFVERGYRLTSDVSALEAGGPMFEQHSRRERGAGFYRIATLAVDPITWHRR